MHTYTSVTVLAGIGQCLSLYCMDDIWYQTNNFSYSVTLGRWVTSLNLSRLHNTNIVFFSSSSKPSQCTNEIQNPTKIYCPSRVYISFWFYDLSTNSLYILMTIVTSTEDKNPFKSCPQFSIGQTSFSKYKYLRK